MTRDEIMKMKPGWELDALVAEKVMGHKICKNAIGAPFISDGIYGVVVPNYSTDIAAAWEVLEKMGGFTLVPAGRNIHGKISFWYAGKKYIDGNKVYEVNDARNPTTGCGETAPEAICKAALLAVMDGEDEHERD